MTWISPKYEIYDKEQAEVFDDCLGYNTPFGNYKLDRIADKIFEISGMENKKVLEVAGGTGELMRRYAKKVKKSVFSDLSTNNINVAKTKKMRNNCRNTDLIIADALNLPFEDDSFDIVIERAISLLVYDKFLEDGTAREVLEEMKRVSKDKIIIIHANRLPVYLLNKKTPYHYFTGKELRKMLENLGLDNVKIMYVTHSVPLLFNLFGEAKLKRIEKVIENTPFIRAFGGGIIACGSKMMNKK